MRTTRTGTLSLESFDYFNTAVRRQSWLESQTDWNTSIHKQMESHSNLVAKLDLYYRKVSKEIMVFQSPFGLFPSFSEKEQDCAHVRDNIFCALAIWAMHQSYKHIDDDGGRTYELGQCAVKCMRAILYCWMRQADKVEKFKADQCLENALHSKFTLRGREIISERDYGHMQLYCVSLYLISLAQMITSGLELIYSANEVDFIQQLVFYVERAYRTPDFGFWSRGTKYNNFQTELHASATGAAKAALEAMNGFNLYGDKGSTWSSIYVDIDAYNRNRTTFDTLLPRESASKNTDAALLFTVSWPIFAIHDRELIEKTINKCIRKLEGQYGFKRFLRDGEFTVVEGKDRPRYKCEEVKKFDQIECQWPMFFALMIIDGIFKNQNDKVEQYLEKLRPLLKSTAVGDVIPMYYFLPMEQIEQHRKQPESSSFYSSDEAMEGKYFLFGQSIWFITQLLMENILTLSDLDPIGRHLLPIERPKQSTRHSAIQGFYADLVVHVVPIAESARLQQLLFTYGIATQTPKQIEPIKICPPSELVRAYTYLGVNEKLHFTGRPSRPIGVLGTSKIYRICSETVLCYPLTFETMDFYISRDLSLLLDNVRGDFEFLNKCWKLRGRPVYCILIREQHVKGAQKHEILDLLLSIKQGEINGVRVSVDRLQTVIPTVCIEHLDFLDNVRDEFVFNPFPELDIDGWYYKSLTEIPHDDSQNKIPLNPKLEDFSSLSYEQLETELKKNDNLWYHCQVLAEFKKRYGFQHLLPNDQGSSSPVQELLEKICESASENHNWLILRYCSSVLHKFVDSLAPSITNIVVRGKMVSLGLLGQHEVNIFKPVKPQEIFTIVYETIFPTDPFFAVMVQEMILVISNFISTDPMIFDGILKLRMGWIFEAMKLEMDSFTKEISEPVEISLSVSHLYALFHGHSYRKLLSVEFERFFSVHIIRTIHHDIVLELNSQYCLQLNIDGACTDCRLKLSCQNLEDIYSLSPNELKQLLYYVFTCNSTFERTNFVKRQLDGALSRVPPAFYVHTWSILERTPNGLKVADKFLPQQPTLSDMTDYELNFSFTVEEMLSTIKCPLYRQIIVEITETVYVILCRNKEVQFTKILDLDKLAADALSIFKKETNSADDNTFYELPPSLNGGTLCYIARAAAEYLLQNCCDGCVQGTAADFCNVS